MFDQVTNVASYPTKLRDVTDALSAGPNTDHVDRGSRRGTHAAVRGVRAVQPRNFRNSNRAVAHTGRAQSSPHRAGCRAGPASGPRQTVFRYPFPPSAKAQQSCVSYVYPFRHRTTRFPVTPSGKSIYCMQTPVLGESCAGWIALQRKAIGMFYGSLLVFTRNRDPPRAAVLRFGHPAGWSCPSYF